MSYNAADITELDDVQHTRLRPAVNLGLDVLNTALRELVDNAVEEVADPSHGGSTVTITLHADGSVSVADDGRGLPIDSDPVTGKNGIVKTLGTARAGGKFSAHTDATSTGAGLNGIGAAAEHYFSTTAANLTIAQAATIAGMVQAPNTYRIDEPDGSTQDSAGNPVNSAADGYKLTLDRRNYVLDRMLDLGKISQAEYDEADASPITPAVTERKQGCQEAVGAEFFCEYVRSVLLTDPALVGPMFSGLFMSKMVGFIQSYFPVFLLGAIFGKLMEISGFAKSIVSAVIKVVGARNAMLTIVLVGALLTYGGVSLFVVVFAVYPFAAEMFRQGDIPKRLIPGTIALGAFT